MRMPRLFLLVATVSIISLTAGRPARAADPAVRKDHPRIFVTADTIGALRKKVAAAGKDMFAKMHDADWIMKKTPGTEYTDIHNLPYPAFCYLITGEKKYLDKSREFLDAFARDIPADEFKTPEVLRAVAMAYDWVYNDLTAEERKRFAGAIVKLADNCAKQWRHSDFNNIFVNTSLAVLWAGVALAHDGLEDKAADKYLAQGREYLKSAATAANESAGVGVVGTTQPDGGQFEGFSYNDWGYARPLALTFEMWRTATGEDLFANSGFFKTQAIWHAYCLRPDNGMFARAEDFPSGFGPTEDLRNFMVLVAARYKDPLAQWLADRVERKYVQGFWMDLLWRDDTLAARSPKELNLPAARWFRKLGWVAMRSAWDDPNATFCLFQCQPFYTGHQHLDANSFVIHRAGSLAIDSGSNDYGPHRGNYYCRSIAHNTVLVYDPNEKFSSGTWSDEGPAGSNDGGQRRLNGIERAGQFRAGSPNDTTHIVAFKTGTHFTYVAGNATPAYSRTKLLEFTRQIVFLYPGAFVVFDRVTSAGDFPKTWVLHSINEPKLANGRFSVTEGKGTLMGAVVMPLNAKIATVGGPGKEFLVDGKNYPPEGKVDPEAGSWRVEISPPPADKACSHQFLVVLTANGPADFDVPAYEGGGDINLVAMALTSQGKKYKLLFRRTGELGGHLVVFDKAGKILEEAHLTGGK